MNKVGDLVKCICQPKIRFEDVIYDNKCIKDLDILIKNELGIILKEENGDRYLITFAHLGYNHVLFKGAFVNISDIVREKNET